HRGSGRRATRRRSAAHPAAVAAAAPPGRRADRARTGAGPQGRGDVTLSGDVMRRNVILVAVLAIGLVGCGNFRELFSAHAGVAAEAGGSELAAHRLGRNMKA